MQKRCNLGCGAALLEVPVLYQVFNPVFGCFFVELFPCCFQQSGIVELHRETTRHPSEAHSGTGTTMGTTTAAGRGRRSGPCIWTERRLLADAGPVVPARVLHINHPASLPPCPDETHERNKEDGQIQTPSPYLGRATQLFPFLCQPQLEPGGGRDTNVRERPRQRQTKVRQEAEGRREKQEH